MAVDVGIDVDLLKSEIKKTYASVSEEPEKDFIFPTASSSAPGTVARTRGRTSASGESRGREYERASERASALMSSDTASARSSRRSDIAPNEAAALTGHDLQTWWKSYVQPRKDEQSRKEFVKKLTARGLGVQPEVDQRLTNGS
jgi:hypothetical protein